MMLSNCYLQSKNRKETKAST